MPSRVIVEGPVNHALAQFLAPGLDVPNPKDEKAQGREPAIARAGYLASTIGSHRIALLLDLNGANVTQLEQEVARKLRSLWETEPTRRGPWFVTGDSGVRLVIAGRPNDPVLKSCGVTKFSVDDYMLGVLLDEEGYRGFANHESYVQFRGDAHDLHETLRAVADTLRDRSVVIDSAKRYLDLVDAIFGYNASTVRRVTDILSHCPSSVVDRICGDLRDSLLTDPPF